MSIEILYNRADKSVHYIVTRYLNFIKTRPGVYIRYVTHLHHILPKANDMFPDYKALTIHPWNGVHLTAREHFLAHWMLSRIFPKTSQDRAFFYITNTMRTPKSKDYERAKAVHIANSIKTNSDPLRNLKISAALKNKPKSAAHIEKLTGHIVSDETREKLRIANLGKHASDQSRKKMSLSRTGKTKTKLSNMSKRNISISKMKFKLTTPYGIFDTYTDVATAFNVDVSAIKNIFRKDVCTTVPRKSKLVSLNISYVPNNTWYNYGFYILPQCQPKR